MWNYSKKRVTNEDYYNISNKLRTEKRSNDEFEIMLGSLTFEEMIGLRLEIAARAVDHKLYGFKLWYSVPNIAKEAVLLYTMGAARTKGEAAAFLGLKKTELRKILKKFDIKGFFTKR